MISEQRNKLIFVFINTTNLNCQMNSSSLSKLSPCVKVLDYYKAFSLPGIMSSVLVDRLGRRPLLIWSYLGTALSLFIVGVYFLIINVVLRPHHYINPFFRYIPLTGILLSNIISTLGFNSLLAVIPAEIFPLNVRLVAMASLNIFGGILGFTLAKGYQIIKDLSGLHTVFWVFAFVSLVGAVFSYFLIPETKGKNLAEIQKELQGSYYEDKDININETEMMELNKKDVEAK